MIHGMWSGPWYWDRFKPYFEERSFSCHTPCLRHHDVDPVDDPPEGLGTTSLLDYAADLEVELKKQDEKPIIIGHSMGGLLALILAGRGLAKAAILVTPAPPWGIHTLKWSVLRCFVEPFVNLSWLGRPHRLSFEASVFAFLHLLPPKDQKLLFDKGVAESGKALREIGFWFLDRQMASRVKPESVVCPLLVISGEQDRATPACVVEKIADKYGAAYLSYADHSHSILYENGWEKVAEDIYKWIHTLG